jgi:hypothetical protein
VVEEVEENISPGLWWRWRSQCQARSNKQTYLPSFLKVHRKNDVSVLTNGCGSHWAKYILGMQFQNIPWRPAAWTIDEISADERRSGRETSGDNSSVTFFHWGITIMNVQSSRSTSGPRFILLVTVWKIKRFSRRDGNGNSIFRSRRPGRRRAGSSVSARFVAMITYSSSGEQRYHWT